MHTCMHARMYMAGMKATSSFGYNGSGGQDSDLSVKHGENSGNQIEYNIYLCKPGIHHHQYYLIKLTPLFSNTNAYGSAQQVGVTSEL